MLILQPSPESQLVTGRKRDIDIHRRTELTCYLPAGSGWADRLGNIVYAGMLWIYICAYLAIGVMGNP